MQTYNLPQEIEVWYVIPAIRKELSRILSEKYSLSYDLVANILGVTKSAVSQYNTNKRANKINLHPAVISEVEKSAQRIIKEKEKITREMIGVLGRNKSRWITKESILKYQENKLSVKRKMRDRIKEKIGKSDNFDKIGKETAIKEIIRILKFMRDKGLSFEVCEDKFSEHENCEEFLVTYEKYWD